MAISNLVTQRRREILALATRHGARNVRIFGSMARGDDHSDSDLDLLVDVGPNRTPFFPGGLVTDLEELLGRRVDVLTERSLHHSLRDRILAEAVLL